MLSTFRACSRFLVFAFAILTLAGCAYYAPLGPGNIDVQGRLVVSLDSKWNRQVAGPGRTWPESWTQNGPLLDMLCIVPGIEPGKPLLDVTGEAARELPKFREGMSEQDIVTLVQGTLASSLNANDFALRAVAPARVAAQDGVRFEFTFGAGANGEFETDRQAIGAAFVADKRLYLVLFHAAELHYFEKLRPAVEAIIASARLPGRRPPQS
jgi:hypothetical protein